MGRLLQHSQVRLKKKPTKTQNYRNVIIPGSISKIASRWLPSLGTSMGHQEDQIFSWLHQWQPNKLYARLLTDVLLF